MKFIKLVFLAIVLCVVPFLSVFSCDVGWYTVGYTCYRCRAGCYCDGNGSWNGCGALYCSGDGLVHAGGACGAATENHGVRSCPVGFPDTAGTAAYITQCYNTSSIPAGSYMDPLSGALLGCDGTGFYCTGRGSANVYYDPCYQNQNARGLSRCEAGYEPKKITTKPSSCNDSSFQYYYDCKACPEGKWKARGESACQPASVGSCATKNGQCAGEAYDKTKATDEKECAVGTCATKGGNCLDGQTGGSKCKTCDLGQCSSKDGRTCAVNQTGASYCITCPGNTVNDMTGQSSCTACSPGYAPNGNHTACEACDGFIDTDGSCNNDCPDGYECHDGVKTRCTGNTIGKDGVCVPCAGGRVSNSDHTQCVACKSPGYYSTGDTCEKCPKYDEIKSIEGAEFFKESGKADNSITSCRYSLPGSAVSESLPVTMISSVNNLSVCAKAFFEYSAYYLQYAEYRAYAKENYYVSIVSGTTKKTVKCLRCGADDATSGKNFSDGGTSECHACGGGYCWTRATLSSPYVCHQCSAGFSCPVVRGTTSLLAREGITSRQCVNISSEYNKTPEEQETEHDTATTITLYGVTPCSQGSYSTGRSATCTKCASNYTTSGNNGCRTNNGTACFTPSACIMKDVALSIKNGNSPITQILSKYPQCIIADKIDRTVVKQFE